MMIEIEPVTNITLAGLYVRRKQIRARLMRPQLRAAPIINFCSLAPTPYEPAITPPANEPPIDIRESAAEEAAGSPITVPQTNFPLTARRIVKEVAAFYDVSPQDIISRSRLGRAVKCRQIAHFLAKTLTRKSLPQIGRLIGGRDHSTVLHSVRKIDALRATDAVLAADIDELTLKLSSDESRDRSEQDVDSDSSNDERDQENQPESN